MRPEKKEQIDSIDKFVEAGVPDEWVNIVQSLGFKTVDSLAEAKTGKLHQDLCGYNKKNKLGLQNPTLDDVKKWVVD